MGGEGYRLLVNKGKLLWSTGAATARALIGNTNSISQYTARHRLIDFYHWIPPFLTMSCCFHTVTTWGVWKSVSVCLQGLHQHEWKERPLIWPCGQPIAVDYLGPSQHPADCPLICKYMFDSEGCDWQKFWQNVNTQSQGQNRFDATCRLKYFKPYLKTIYLLHFSTVLNWTFSNQVWKMDIYLWKEEVIKLTWQWSAD